MTTFDHKKIEEKWKKSWKDKDVYGVDMENPTSRKASRGKWYNLMMFPYPSAEGLHVGNMYAFTGADIYGRYKAMQGFDVFEPIGLDGFGIHSENYAIKIGKHPKEQAKISEKRFYEQLSGIGNRFNWGHRLETYDPEYYKWTQWIFIKMHENGLAYRKKSLVNWCPSCKTVLSDEQVEAGVCERCKTETEKKETFQWFFKITDYAQRLLDNIDKIDWPNKIKTAQRNWIGRKEGIDISYQIKGLYKGSEPLCVTCFTTTPVNFGATFIVIGPEHELIKKWSKDNKKVAEYVKKALKKSDIERIAEGKKKTGEFTGFYAINHVDGKEIPIYVADFVLGHVGTGAVQGCPAHDERDFEFARKYKLPIIKVVDILSETHSLVMKKSVDDKFIEEVKENKWYSMDYEGWGYGVVVPAKDDKKYIEIVQKHLKDGPWYVHTDGSSKVVIYKDKVFDVEKENVKAKKYGKGLSIPDKEMNWDDKNNYMFCITNGDEMVNSEFLDGIEFKEAMQKTMDYFEEKGWGKRVVSYRLRDWCISRQRYWGPPIPMIECPKCGYVPEKIENLPVELPDVEDYKPTGDGKSPLEKASEKWLYTKCPKCGGKAKRETDVSDTFLDSAWYFLRYPSIKTTPLRSDKSHLRGDTIFDKEITKKWLPVDAYIGGAEHAVLHLMYSRFVTMALKDWGMLDFEEPFPFLFGHGLIIKDGSKMSKSKGNIINPDEYLEKYGVDALRMYLMFVGPYEQGGDFRDTGMVGMKKFLDRLWRLFDKKVGEKTSEKLLVKLEQTIKKVGGDMGSFGYNTAIASLMECINVWREEGERLSKDDGKRLVKLLAPVAPYVSEELWGKLGGEKSVHNQLWPSYDKKLAEGDKKVIVVQINGKLRGQLEVDRKEAEDKGKMLKMAQELALIKKHVDGKKVVKEIFVPGRLVNLVVK